MTLCVYGHPHAKWSHSSHSGSTRVDSDSNRNPLPAVCETLSTPVKLCCPLYPRRFYGGARPLVMWTEERRSATLVRTFCVRLARSVALGSACSALLCPAMPEVRGHFANQNSASRVANEWLWRGVRTQKQTYIERSSV